jgi:signal transduction histidine kinase
MENLLETWLAISIRAPLIVVILIILFTISSMGFGVWFLITRKKRMVNLSKEIQELNIQLAKQNDDPPPQSAHQEAYQQFIYNISHEVANPLQSIQTNLDNMIECSPDEVGRWWQYHQIISTEIKRLSVMTENLRLLSRLETANAPVKREPINMKAVIEDVIMSLYERAEEKGVKLVYNGPNRPARVFGNRDQLRQVLMNVIDNGIKYSKETGGQITISVQDDQEHLRVRVSDEGIGMPEEDLPYIFDTAYRVPSSKSLRRAGTGLGLAIAKRIIEQHGGLIHVHSQVGDGTTISLNLPLYHPS